MPDKYKTHLFLFLVSLIYAGNYTIAKEAMPAYISPFGFIFLRASFGALFFTLFHKFFINEVVDRKDLPYLFICAIFGIAINQLFFFKGLSLTQPINASLIMILIPSLVVLLSFFILKEKITKRKTFGITMGLLGAFIIIFFSNNESQFKLSIGDLMILVNATCYSFYLLLVKKMMVKYHPITVLKWVFTFGFIMIIPFGIKGVISVDFLELPLKVWLVITYVLIGVSVLTYLLNGLALKTASPTLVSTYVYLQPLLATIIAISFKKDSIDETTIIAGLLIFIGVYQVSFSKKKFS